MSIAETLVRFDDVPFDLTRRPVAAIPNGLFTMTFPDGTHRTFRIHTKSQTAKFAPGERVLSLLAGPDNEQSYKAFAFVSEHGVRVWNRHRGTILESYVEPFLNLALGKVVPGFTLEVSKRCLVCNRTLTTPESLALGIGPNCWERMYGNG